MTGFRYLLFEGSCQYLEKLTLLYSTIKPLVPPVLSNSSCRPYELWEVHVVGTEEFDCSLYPLNTLHL